MYFIGTRGGEKVTGAQAIVNALAENGGLYVPETIPKITAQELEALAETNYAERVAFVLNKFFGEELGAEFLKETCAKAYTNFRGGDPAPLVKVDGKLFMLELFHGQTCAFQDMALSIFPAVLKKSAEVLGIKDELLVLVATSGSTGKATMESFRDEKGAKVAVFYPDEGVAKMQRLQLCIQDGDNLSVSAVRGTFDDCQRLVRRMMQSEEFNQKLAGKGVRLACTNSINFLRIAAQIAYYLSAYIDLLNSDQIQAGDKVDFVVPTGSFGNILAGWYAKKMGLPVGKLVSASNRNRTVAEFFKKGVYDIKRNYFRTMSPSLDVLVASNVERLLFEVGGRKAKTIAERMQALQDKKEYLITTAEKNVLDDEFFAGFASEDDTVEAMYEVFEEYGYAMDTHTGVALAVYNQYMEALEKDESAPKHTAPIIVLATANPYKFPQDVLYALSGNDVKDSFKGIKRLNLLTAMKPPKCLLDLRYRPLRFKAVVDNDLAKACDAVLRFVDGEVIPVPDAKK